MIYLITNRKLCSEDHYLASIKTAAEAGVDKIILREKDLNNEEYEKLYYKIKSIVPEKTEIIVNSNIEAFNKVKAHTIQLSYKDFLNNKVIPHAHIGVSVHSVEEGLKCDSMVCKYILASHIFPTKCKEGLAPKGVAFISELKKKVKCPVIALGGIDISNASLVKGAGADGIALMSAFFKAESVETMTSKLCDIMKA